LLFATIPHDHVAAIPEKKEYVSIDDLGKTRAAAKQKASELITRGFLEQINSRRFRLTKLGKELMPELSKISKQE